MPMLQFYTNGNSGIIMICNCNSGSAHLELPRVVINQHAFGWRTFI